MKSALFTCFVLVIATDIAVSAQRKKPQATRNRVADQSPITEAVNNPVWAGATPAAVLRAQILLDRAHFSPGEIDSRPGANFERALRAFQNARKIPVTGQVDEATWLAMNTDTSPALTPYRISKEDVSGPFTDIQGDLMEQAKLKRLGYTSAEEALAEQFHLSPSLLRQLNSGKKFAAGEEILVPNVQTTARDKASKVVVSRAGTVSAIDASGNLIAHYPASSGSEHDPLPVGLWKITGIYRDPSFHYNPELFWDADPSHAKAKIAPGPNNPVGVVWIDLSKEHYGIHGTPEPGKVGHAHSHGCIRLTNWDARELAGLVAKGVTTEMVE